MGSYANLFTSACGMTKSQTSLNAAFGLSSPSPTGPAEHARVVSQRFRFFDDYSAELSVRWVNKPIVLVRCEDRGDQQQAVFSLAHEFVADFGELRWCRRSSPVREQISDFNPFPAQIIWQFCYG